jgi:2-polyprenyl-6-methoxyphenol hydroxylase-like FAD-dependent oxidoreductase
MGGDRLPGAIAARRATSSMASRWSTGLVALGDAQQCTDPSLGRGMTMGLMHTEVLCDVLREHDAGSAELAVAFDAMTRAVIGPWYEATVQKRSAPPRRDGRRRSR